MRILHLANQVPETSDSNTFTGHARLTRMTGLSNDFEVNAYRVEFDQEARTAWHVHSGPQLLIVLDGHCRLQRKGEPIQKLVSGDIACIAAGERHWHGASPDIAMTHIAININSTTTWLEKVTDTEYNGST